MEEAAATADTELLLISRRIASTFVSLHAAAIRRWTLSVPAALRWKRITTASMELGPRDVSARLCHYIKDAFLQGLRDVNRTMMVSIDMILFPWTRR